MGPGIVTADEIPDPQPHLRLAVNGAVKQEDTTAHMLFDVPAIIEELALLTLEPGDIIATGTPAGVGFARTPPEFLQPGDIVETEIVEIGMMRNKVGEHSAIGRASKCEQASPPVASDESVVEVIS